MANKLPYGNEKEMKSYKDMQIAQTKITQLLHLIELLKLVINLLETKAHDLENYVSGLFFNR